MKTKKVNLKQSLTAAERALAVPGTPQPRFMFSAATSAFCLLLFQSHAPHLNVWKVLVFNKSK